MSSPLNLETYTAEELEQIIPALGTFIKPIPYNGRYIASCAHYLDDCSLCPLYEKSGLCDSMYVYCDEEIEDRLDYDSKFFPRNFVKHHPEYLI